MNVKGIIKDTIIITLITLIAGFSLGYAHEVTKEPIKQQRELEKMNALKNVFASAAEFNLLFDDSEELTEEGLKLQEEYNKAITDAGFTNTIKLFGEALDENKNVIGYVMNIVSLEGYGTDIVVSVGMDTEGKTNGVYILTIAETPGLGMNATSPDFIGQFADKNVEKFVYVKAAKSDLTSDDQIAAISGATITTNAIVNLVNSAKAVFNVAGGK